LQPISKRRKSLNSKTSNGANLGFEEKLWQAADKLRGNMDAADYKHVVLGLIFLKYISDAFQERFEALNNVFKRTIIKLAAEAAGLSFGKDVVVEF
jgi:type I restriction-modification system DNA methylase subunit